MSRNNPLQKCNRRNARNPRDKATNKPIPSRRTFLRRRLQTEHVAAVRQNPRLTNYETSVFQEACQAAYKRGMATPDWRDYVGVRETRNGG